MPRHAADALGDQIRLPVVIVNAVDHGIFEADAAARLFKIPVAGGKQFLHIIGAIHRHDPGPGLAVRRMEGHRQRQLQIQLRQRVDLRHDAAGGQADMPHPDVQAFRAVDQFQKF